MLRSVFFTTVSARRRSIVGWCIGMAAFGAYGVAFWPTIRDSAAELNRLIEDLPPVLKAFAGGETVNYGTPEGYLGSQAFGFTLPLLLLIFAVGFGSRTVAGEERRGTLELVLAAPVPRWRLVAEKIAALLTATTLVGAVLWVSLTGLGAAVGLGIPTGRLAAAVAMAVLLAVAFGTLALAVGCATGKRSIAVGATSVVAVATYLVKTYSPFSDTLEDLRVLSPFYYYDAAEPLQNGLDPSHALFFAVLLVAFIALALVTFERRDIGV